MTAEMGEYVVGAYLKLILECDMVDYNVRPPGGGRNEQAELDVIGLRFSDNTAYICEVATHLDSVLYGSGNVETVAKIKSKHGRQLAYAEQYLSSFETVHYMFWAPVMQRGYITTHLAEVTSLELVVNSEFKRCVEELRALATTTKQYTGNPFFRALQILASLRE